MFRVWGGHFLKFSRVASISSHFQDVGPVSLVFFSPISVSSLSKVSVFVKSARLSGEIFECVCVRACTRARLSHLL